MAAADPFVFEIWRPEGVSRVFGNGLGSYVALYGDDQVLKYPLVPPQETNIYDEKGTAIRANLRERSIEGLRVEEQILRVLGNHPRIVRLIQKHPDGIVLEYVPNDSIGYYLRDIDPNPPLQQRLKWARQAAEAVAYIHSKNVLHCDISIGNLLLDADLDVKLIDFQGRLLAPDGTVLLDGQSGNGAMASMPRSDPNHFDFKTDIFALGTSIYYIMTGQLPFPDLDPVMDDEEIERRFRVGQLPSLEEHRGGVVVWKCWQGSYESAQDVVVDLQNIEAVSTTKSDCPRGGSSGDTLIFPPEKSATASST